MNLTKTPYLVLFIILGAIGVTAVSAVALVTIDNLKVTGDTELDGKLLDTNDEAGTSGQVLSSIETGTDWIDVPSGADGSDGISPLTSIRVTTTEPEFLLPTDETVIGVAPTSHIFLPLGIPDGKIIVIKNAGCGCILSAQEDDEILNGDIILGFTDAVVLQYLNGIWFEIAEYAGLPAPP